MANYISNEILCEAYTHLDIDLHSSPQKLDELRVKMKGFLEERAKFLFGENVQVVIEFEEGSLKAKLKVMGNVALVLGVMVTNYGSFRDSVHALSADAATLAQSANLEMVFRTKTAYCDRISIERRKGVFGRVDELIRDLENTRKLIADSSFPTRTRDIHEFNSHIDGLIHWEEKYNKLLEKLDSESAEACITAGLLEEIEKFPAAVAWEAELASNSLKSQIAGSDPDKSGKIAASASRYKATIQSIKKNLVQTLKEIAPTNA